MSSPDNCEELILDFDDSGLFPVEEEEEWEEIDVGDFIVE